MPDLCTHPLSWWSQQQGEVGRLEHVCRACEKTQHSPQPSPLKHWEQVQSPGRSQDPLRKGPTFVKFPLLYCSRLGDYFLQVCKEAVSEEQTLLGLYANLPMPWAQGKMKHCSEAKTADWKKKNQNSKTAFLCCSLQFQERSGTSS